MSSGPRKKILFYCQHLIGVGHLTRSLALVDALSASFDVAFVQGGPDVGRVPRAATVRRMALAPLLMEEGGKELFDPLGKRSVAEIWEERRAALARIALEHWDAVIIELFPFGRKKFRDEILAFLAAARATNPKLRVYSSLRDILVEKSGQAARDGKIVDLVREYFDSVFVHADPAVVALEESFSQVEALGNRLRYTGFVTEGAAHAPAADVARGKRILVSQGGGIVGSELLLAALGAAPLLREYEFALILGPNAREAQREAITRGAAALANVNLIPFGPNFEAELARSALSVSLGGYNTVMNLLNTRTFGLVYPYDENREQRLRAERLARRGFLALLEPEELAPAPLAQRIRAALLQKYPEMGVRLDGAQTTRHFLAGDLGL